MPVFKPPYGSQINWGHPLAQGLRCAYPFTEGEGGIIHDVGPFGAHLEAAASADYLWVGTPYGWGLDLAGGANDWFQILESREEVWRIDGSMTVFAIAKFDTLATHNTIVMCENVGNYAEGWGLKANSSTELEFWWTNHANDAVGTTVSAGNYYSLVGVRDGADPLTSLYQDGVIQSDTDTTGGDPSYSVDNAIGYFGRSFGSDAWDGTIVAVLIWDRALSAGEVASLLVDPFAMFREPDPVFMFAVGTGAQIATPDALEAIAEVLDPTIVLGAVTATPSVLESKAEALAPTVALGTVTAAPGALEAVAEVLAPTIVLGAVTATPGVLEAIAEVLAPTVSSGVVVTPSTLEAVAEVLVPTVSLGAVTVTLDVLESTAAIPTPTVTLGTVTATPPVLESTAAVLAPTVALGGVTASLGVLEMVASVPTVSTSTGAQLSGITIRFPTTRPTIRFPTVRPTLRFKSEEKVT